MSFAVTAAVVITAGASYYQAKEQQKANEKAQARATQQAKEDALETSLQNRRSEIFAETEGQGTGQLGQISLAIDEEEDVDNVLSI